MAGLMLLSGGVGLWWGISRDRNAVSSTSQQEPIGSSPNGTGRSAADAVEPAVVDITTVGIEFGVVLGSIKRAAESLEAGTTCEVAIGTDKMVTLIRTLGETYFLAVALRPDGNLGKGRFLMRTAAPKLLAELG